MPTLSAAFHRRVPLRRLSDVPADSYFGRLRDVCLALGFLFSLNEVEFCLFIGCLQPLPLPFFLSFSGVVSFSGHTIKSVLACVNGRPWKVIGEGSGGGGLKRCKWWGLGGGVWW